VIELNFFKVIFFPAKIFFCILEKGNLAGKKLLCKEGYPFIGEAVLKGFLVHWASLVEIQS
jgi:hypothetical protein